LLSAIKKYLADNVNVIGANSGLHIVLEVKKEMEADELIRLATDAGVKIYPLSIYYHGTQVRDSKVLLGFGGLSESEIDMGIRLLKEAWGL
ncbi:PLP-dependent aminotransferase family protein, partial [Alkalihalophilus lindianensis]|nr:PLP-dependent aminotransferase family protein [Alkalihalophilus lindianensis]